MDRGPQARDGRQRPIRPDGDHLHGLGSDGCGSPTRTLEAERPRRIKSRFGSSLLRGETEATIEHDSGGTSLTQRFRTEGLVSAIAARVFGTGSWRGSFRGELATFAKLAEREAAAGMPLSDGLPSD